MGKPALCEGLSVELGFWNTICTAESWSAVRLCAVVEARSEPSTTSVPLVASCKPARMRAKVDLPEPDSPTMAMISLFLTAKFRSSLAVSCAAGLLLSIEEPS